jgi:hypothetical protein
MNRREFLKAVPAVAALAATASAFADEPAPASSPATTSRPLTSLKPITLVKPQTDGGKTVMASLWERKTIRNISDKALPPQGCRTCSGRPSA